MGDVCRRCRYMCMFSCWGAGGGCAGFSCCPAPDTVFAAWGPWETLRRTLPHSGYPFLFPFTSRLPHCLTEEMRGRG